MQTSTPPYELEAIWQVYRRIHRRRHQTGYGPGPVTFRDIRAFEKLSGISLDVFEVAILESVDDRFLQVVSEMLSKK